MFLLEAKETLVLCEDATVYGGRADAVAVMLLGEGSYE